MPLASFSSILRRGRRKNDPDGSKGCRQVMAQSAGSSTAAGLPTAQEQQEREADDRSRLPEPYANSVDMWNKGLESLDDVARNDIKHLVRDLGSSAGQDNPKNLATAVSEQMRVLFKAQQQDSGVDRIIENTVAALGKLLSTGDVLVSIDPIHAAPPWAVVRSVLVLLTSNSELKSRLCTGIAMVVSLLVQCGTCQQLYMTPDYSLRPPETALSELKTSIVQTYAESQRFLSFAIQQRRGWTKPIAAPFNLGDAEGYANTLSKCNKQLSQATDNCEKYCGLSDRHNVQKLLELNADLSEVFQEQMYVAKYLDRSSTNPRASNLVLNKIDTMEQTRVLEWISPIPYGQHHNRVKDARTIDTCEWLLRHDKFREWEESNKSTVLWLQGSPGAGKTFLTSKVVDRCRARLESSPSQEGFAFFYCDRNEEQRRQPLSVLQSYVRQLSTTVKSPGRIRKQLQDFCRTARESGSDLGFNDCREQLLQSISLYSQTTVVLDALDECEAKSRGQILEVLEYLISRPENVVKVFISSRPDRDIKNRFLNTPNIEIQATDNEQDIQTFVRKEITRHGHWKGMSQNLQNDIITTLFDKSQGMFQWAFLQINELLDLESESAIRDRLGMLPTDLKTAYDNIYGKIKSRNQHDRALAENAFKWVACASYPLGQEELLSAIRLDADTTNPNLHDTIEASQLLHLCNNLLVIDSKRMVWKFSHLSVVEYFEENHWDGDLRRAHSHAASVCLKVLIEGYRNFNLDEIASGEYGSIRARDRRNGESEGNFNYRNVYMLAGLLENHLQLYHSFNEYARRNWIFHIYYQEGQDADSTLAQLLKSFLGSPQESSSQYRAWYLHSNATVYCNYLPRNRDIELETVSLFAMCGFSFYHILRDWWEDAEFDISITTRDGYNLLALAARGGCKEICENLIRRGIKVDRQLQNDQHGSALAAAVETGNMKVVKFLVDEAHADVNMQLQNGTSGSALAAAAYCGRIGIVKFLVDNPDTDVNMQLQNGKYGSALAAAAARIFNLEVVKFLVNEAGADVNMQLQNGEYGSALAAAAANGFNLEVVKFLVNEAGADVNMPLQNGIHGGSALATAVAMAYGPEVVEFLVNEAGAKVDMQLQNGNFGSALAAATWATNSNSIGLLLQSGAQPNMSLQNGRYGSALAAAVVSPTWSRFDILLLLKSGADVNMQLETGRYGTALIFAIEHNASHKVKWPFAVEYLVDHTTVNIDQQVQHGEFGSALAAAAFFGSRKCAGILIDAGANVHLEIKNGLFSSALQACQGDTFQDGRWDYVLEGKGKKWRSYKEWKKGRDKVANLLQSVMNQLEE